VHLKEAVTTISGARRLIDLCDELMSSPDFDPDQMTTTERELMARVVAYICRTAMSERCRMRDIAERVIDGSLRP
jgi:hypothetical protein